MTLYSTMCPQLKKTYTQTVEDIGESLWAENKLGFSHLMVLNLEVWGWRFHHRALEQSKEFGQLVGIYGNHFGRRSASIVAAQFCY